MASSLRLKSRDRLCQECPENKLHTQLHTHTLAPRGGAWNICDETKPYLDNAHISIERIGDAAKSDKDGWLLVVGTEAEVWRYRLDIICTTRNMF